MRELRIHAYCDACQADGRPRTEVDPDLAVTTVALREGEPRRTLDLCEKHTATLLDPLRLLLGEPVEDRGDDVDDTAPAPPAVAVKVRRPAIALDPVAQRGEFACPLCPLELTNRRNLVRHLEAVHHLERPAQPARCPDCDHEPGDPSQMTAHRAVAHGYRVLDEMLTAAGHGR